MRSEYNYQENKLMRSVWPFSDFLIYLELSHDQEITLSFDRLYDMAL